MTLDGEQRLVLARCEARLPSGLGTEGQKSRNQEAELGEQLVISA